MSASAEKCLLDTLSSVSNSSTNNGPSFNFHSNITPEELLQVRTPIMQDFLEANAAKYRTEGGHILDAACGSGKDAALLISKGFKLVSCDLSDGMVQLARRNREKFLELGRKEYEHWAIFEGDMCKLKETVMGKSELPQQYDFITCIGNSIPFVLSMEDVTSALANFAKLLRPGGALMLDHRNFLPMLTKGKVNKNGHNPCTVEKFNALKDIIPHLVYGPGPEKDPIVAFLEFQRTDGIMMYFTYRIFTPESMTVLAKKTFGEDCVVHTYYDLKPESECSAEDACWVTYIIEKA